MKNKILLLLISAMAFVSCFDQSRENCPADMLLTFSVEDPYEPGDTYDSRLRSDVMLYIFKDMRVISGSLIPYDKISAGKPYVIHKDDNLSGNLNLVAWTVPSNRDLSIVPHLSIGDNLYDIYRRLEQITRTATDYYPAKGDLHVARITTFEPVDVETKHNLKLNYSDCRMEVRVIDRGNVLSQSGSNPSVCVYGTMEAMDMDGKGVAKAAIVHAKLSCPSNDNISYTTGRFGVLPSQANQTVSVKIIDGLRNVATLAVPRSAMPQGAVSGGFIIFEYIIDAPEFTLIVDGFRQNIVIVNDM